jgi:hypothetical protein
MSRDPDPTGHRAASWVATGALSLLVVLVVRPPWAPTPYLDWLDDAWRLALSVSFLEGRAFGREVIFTFGPLGFLHNPGPMPGTYPLALAAWVVLASLMWAAAFHLARRRFARWPLALVWLLALIGAISWTDEAFFLSLAAAVLVLHFDGLVDADSLPAVPLLAALAVGALVKFSFLPSAIVVLGAVTADALRQRRVPRAAVVFAVFFVGTWAIAGQRVADLPAFLASGSEVMAGYSVNMSIPGPTAPAVFAAGAGFLLVLAVLTLDRPGRLLGAAALSALLLLAFKAGFVRHAETRPIAFDSLGAIGLLQLPSLLRSRRAARVLAGLSAVCLGLWVLSNPGMLPARRMLSRAGSRATANLDGIWTLARRGFDDIRAGYADTLRVLAARHPIPPGVDAIEVYSWGLNVPIAHGLRLRSRPAFQSYMTYSPWLAERNAAWIRGPEAPPVVLFDGFTVDGHFPALEDGLSWPELWTRYDVVDTFPGTLVLRRRATARRYGFSAPIESTIRIGESVPIPAVSLLWARLDVQPTLAGRLLSVLYKLPPIVIEVRQRNRSQTFRLVESARAGFLLSPVVDDRVAFALLGATLDPRHPGAEYLAERRVARLTVNAGASARWYRPDVRLSLQTLHLSPGGPSLPPGVERRLGLLLLAHHARRTGQRAFLATTIDGESRVVTPGSSRIPVARHGNGARLRLGFGLLDGPGHNAASRCATVEFRVAAAADDAVLWLRRLTRDGVTAGTLPESAEVELGSAGDVVVEVVPPSADCASAAYWSEVTAMP